MVKNPFLNMSDKKLREINADIEQSKEEGRMAESLVPYAQAIPDEIDKEFFTLSEEIQWVKDCFYSEVARRFCDKNMYKFLRSFLVTHDWELQIVREQARAIFTAMCIMDNIYPDTSVADKMLMELYEDSLAEGSYDEFELFMYELLV